ncbi:ferredoxin--NADP(+) reductase [Deferribacterales bacterium]|nr:ferredoxin--NADP(+) reductase [Deferribacterales bacterium]
MMYKVVSKVQLSEGVALMTVYAPYVARGCQPGQFVIVCANDDSERIPLTIEDYDRDEGTINIIYQVVGYSTRELDGKCAGDNLSAVAGPLGEPAHYPVENLKSVLGIGGGVGIAPLYPQMKHLKQMGVRVDCVLGGRNRELVILKREFEAFADSVLYATDDGSLGIKGVVTDVLKSQLEKGVIYDLVVAIGPMIMMKAVVDYTKPLGLPTGVSLNPLMVDGTGMCGGCRVSVGGEVKFACVDGPDFDGLKVDFEETMKRQSFYKDEEHECNLRKLA